MKAGKIKMVICVQRRNDERVPFAHCIGLDRSMILNSTNEKVLCFQNSRSQVCWLDLTMIQNSANKMRKFSRPWKPLARF